MTRSAAAARVAVVVQEVMGTAVSFQVRGPAARAVVGPATSVAMQLLRDVDLTFSTYRPQSQVSRIRAGTLDPRDARPDVREVIHLCGVADHRTNGAFSCYLPDDDGVRRFDPTGLVKGWAVQRAADAIHLPDGHDLAVNAGGDIAFRSSSGAAWTFAVEDPTDPSLGMATISMLAGGIATSGTGRRGAHIIDPATGARPQELMSVTVFGESLLWADVYATAAFTLGAAAASWLQRLPGYGGVVVSRGASGGPVATAVEEARSTRSPAVNRALQI